MIDVEILAHRSEVLRGNPLRDPVERDLPVLLPPSYRTSAGKRYPVAFLLAGFTGTGPFMLNRRAFEENAPERLWRAMKEGRIRECLVAMPDCMTRLGGSQYVNSEGVGAYEDYVVKELVPLVDAALRTKPAASARAVLGRSSGGFGAYRLAARHPNVFGHAASLCGDMGFELCYGADFPKYAAAVGRYGGTTRFVRNLAGWDSSDKDFHTVLNVAAMSACYSPNRRSPHGFDLPFDEHTAELKPAVWRKWLAHDPLRFTPGKAANLRALKSLWIDCGDRDEFHLQFGARRLARLLTSLRVAHRHEEFPGGHFTKAGRDVAALAWMSKRMR